MDNHQGQPHVDPNGVAGVLAQPTLPGVDRYPTFTHGVAVGEATEEKGGWPVGKYLTVGVNDVDLYDLWVIKETGEAPKVWWCVAKSRPFGGHCYALLQEYPGSEQGSRGLMKEHAVFTDGKDRFAFNAALLRTVLE